MFDMTAGNCNVLPYLCSYLYYVLALMEFTLPLLQVKVWRVTLTFIVLRKIIYPELNIKMLFCEVTRAQKHKYNPHNNCASES